MSKIKNTPKPVDVDALTTAYRASRTAHEAAQARNRAVIAERDARYATTPQRVAGYVPPDDRLALLDAEGDALEAEQAYSEASAALVQALASQTPDAPHNLVFHRDRLAEQAGRIAAKVAELQAAIAAGEAEMQATVRAAVASHELESQRCAVADLPPPLGIPGGSCLADTLRALDARIAQGAAPKKDNRERLRRVRRDALDLRVELETALREREDEERRAKAIAERDRQTAARLAADAEREREAAIARAKAEHAERLEIARAYEARRGSSVDRMIARRTAETSK